VATGSATILEGRHAGAATHQPDDDAPPVSTLGRAAAPLIAAGRRKNRGDDGPRVRLSRGGPHRTRRPAASAWCGGRTAGWGQGGLTLTIAAVACGLEHERAVGGAAWRTFSRLAGACGGAASPARVQTAAWLSRILGRGGALAASRVRPAQLCSAHHSPIIKTVYDAMMRRTTHYATACIGRDWLLGLASWLGNSHGQT